MKDEILALLRVEHDKVYVSAFRRDGDIDRHREDLPVLRLLDREGHVVTARDGAHGVRECILRVVFPVDPLLEEVIEIHTRNRFADGLELLRRGHGVLELRPILEQRCEEVIIP